MKLSGKLSCLSSCKTGVICNRKVGVVWKEEKAAGTELDK